MAMKMIAGLDIGNGYVKSSVMGAGTGMTDIDIPSCAIHRVAGDGGAKKTSPEDVAEEIAKIYDQMDVTFDSPLIPDRERFFIGRRAVTCGREPMEFNINSVKHKAKQPLTPMLALACVAGKALQDAYAATGKLPDKPIDVEVVAAAMALPIVEFKDMRKGYTSGYTDNAHAVTFYNFDDAGIRVNIRFLNVMVNAEGAAAQFGIVSKGPDLIEAMLQDIRQNGVPLAGYKAADIMNATSTLGVDIGEGTVNFPVFTSGRFNDEASDTLDMGYGKVMELSVKELRKQGQPYKSRKELTEFLNNPTMNPSSIIYQRRYLPVQKVVDGQIAGFVDSVNNMFGKVLNNIGTQVEVIYVYGGGATPLQGELLKKMFQTLANFEAGGNVQEIITPLLYMDSRYSRNLNREGLFAMAEAMAAQVGKK